MSLFDRIQGQQMQPPLTVQDIQRDPIGIGRQKGYNIPDNIGNEPRNIAMHLIQTGQVGGPMLQKIMPMIRNLIGR